VVLLKHNRAVAAVVPIIEEDDQFDLWGAMRDTVKVAPGVDLTAPAGEIWDAEV
jgi:hypothetical protein